MASTDRQGTPDPAELNAFFPSPFSLTQYVGPKSDYDGTNYDNVKKYTGPLKILALTADERYLLCKNDKFFSTGNHPVEALLPIWHLDSAGFDVDIVTTSGLPTKIEHWAVPHEDAVVPATLAKYAPKLRAPLKLSDVLQRNLDEYAAIFIPGGHSALYHANNDDVRVLLELAHKQDKLIITLCHGPAALIAPTKGGQVKPEDYIFDGYEIVVFPDSLDEGINIDIGYIPGRLPFLIEDSLAKYNIKVLNTSITGQVHQHKELLTGDSPLASNALGKKAAQLLLEKYVPQ